MAFSFGGGGANASTNPFGGPDNASTNPFGGAPAFGGASAATTAPAFGGGGGATPSPFGQAAFGGGGAFPATAASPAGLFGGSSPAPAAVGGLFGGGSPAAQAAPVAAFSGGGGFSAAPAAASSAKPEFFKPHSMPHQAWCRPLTRRLVHQAYRVFVELAMHRRQFDVRKLDTETFGRKVQQCSLRYRKLIESGCRAMESAAAAAEKSHPAGSVQVREAKQEHFTFRVSLILWELYDMLYCRKAPVVVKEHVVVESRSSFARDLLHWCHRHVPVTDERSLVDHQGPTEQVWERVCKCLIQGYFSAALNMLEHIKAKSASSSIFEELCKQIRVLSDGDLLLCFDRYGWSGYGEHDGWTHRSKKLFAETLGKEELSGEHQVAGVLAGQEEILQRFSRHWIDLMLSRLLYFDPWIGTEGKLDELFEKEVVRGGDRRPACIAITDKEVPTLSSTDAGEGLSTYVLTLVQDALSERKPFAPPVPRGGEIEEDSYQLQNLMHFAKTAAFRDGGWFLAHLCDLLDHAVTAEGRQETEPGPQRLDAAQFILEFGSELSSSKARMWELATNYFRFCCQGVNGSNEASLDSDQGEGYALGTLLHQAVPCEKMASKLIHAARHTLSPLSAQNVKADIGKTMAARYWPLPKQHDDAERSISAHMEDEGAAGSARPNHRSGGEGEGSPFDETKAVFVGRPGMCASWLRDDSAGPVLARLVEQLVVGLIHADVGTLASKRLARDSKSVYDVLHQLPSVPGSSATLFVEFFTVWKLQTGLVNGTLAVEPKGFAARVLRVFDHGLVPQKYWLLLFHHLLAPLLELPWRGAVFGVEETYTLMRHFETATREAAFAGDLYGSGQLQGTEDALRYALTENLTEATVSAACC